MKINELIAAHSELTDAAAGKSAVVLMTRIRLARNLAALPRGQRQLLLLLFYKNLTAVEVASEEGRGSTFRCVFPRSRLVARAGSDT